MPQLASAAIRVSGHVAISSARVGDSTGGCLGGAPGRVDEARELPHVPASCRLSDYADDEMAVFDRSLIQAALTTSGCL